MNKLNDYPDQYLDLSLTVEFKKLPLSDLLKIEKLSDHISCVWLYFDYKEKTTTFTMRFGEQTKVSLIKIGQFQERDGDDKIFNELSNEIASHYEAELHIRRPFIHDMYDNVPLNFTELEPTKELFLSAKDFLDDIDNYFKTNFQNINHVNVETVGITLNDLTKNFLPKNISYLEHGFKSWNGP